MPDLVATVIDPTTITVPADANQLECQANQDVIAVSAVTGGYNVTVTDVASYVDGGTTVEATTTEGLFEFTSSDPVQAARGDLEWICIPIQTDENLLNVTWNGHALGQTDIDDAISLGFTDGKTIVFWVPYTELAGDGRTVTIGTVDGSKEAVTIVFTQG